MESSDFLLKAQENLEAAQLCLANNLYNASANRAYYAMLQAAISILFAKGFKPIQTHCDHKRVQSMFADELINRRKIMQSKFRSYLSDGQSVRAIADYETEMITQTKAGRHMAKAKEFVDAIKMEIQHA